MKSECFCLFGSAPSDFFSFFLSCSSRLTQSPCCSPGLSELHCAPSILHDRLVNFLQQAQCRPQREHWWIHLIPPFTQRSGDSIIYLSHCCWRQSYVCQVSAVASLEDDPEWYKHRMGNQKTRPCQRLAPPSTSTVWPPGASELRKVTGRMKLSLACGSHVKSARYHTGVSVVIIPGMFT